MRYHAVLVLARTGATAQAMQRFVEFDLASVDSEDTAALEAPAGQGHGARFHRC